MIRENVKSLLDELPPGITVAAAAKSRTPAEVLEAIEAGIRVVGENYVQEAQAAIAVIGRRVTWHLIGHLQRNKVARAAQLFDLVETIDSFRLAQELDRICQRQEKRLPVLVEVNSAREEGKAGVFPEDAEALVHEIAPLRNLRVVGLMTMGPLTADPEETRPHFRATRQLFERLRASAEAGVEMAVLSMGMSDSYRVAIEEGATMIRVGTRIFGQRPRSKPAGGEE